MEIMRHTQARLFPRRQGPADPSAPRMRPLARKTAFSVPATTHLPSANCSSAASTSRRYAAIRFIFSASFLGGAQNGAGPHRAEAAAVGARGESPGLSVGVHAARDSNLFRLDTQDAGDQLSGHGFVPLPMVDCAQVDKNVAAVVHIDCGGLSRSGKRPFIADMFRQGHLDHNPCWRQRDRLPGRFQYPPNVPGP